MKKTVSLILLSVISGLLGAGILFLASRPPRGSGIRLLPPPTPNAWIVQVSGAVSHPGVYALPAGSRVQDAVQAAGGLAGEASLSGVNLAAPLKDGQNVFIPATTPTAPAPTPKPSVTSQPTLPGENTPPTLAVLPATQKAPAPTPSGELVNINTASLDELDQLPGIGPVIAQRILDYRVTNGPFSAIEDIMNVSGIGPAIFNKIKALITVGP